MKRHLLRLHRKIARVCSGVKILWNNEDWDYYYLLELMHWKMERLEKEIHKNNNFVGSGEVTDRLYAIRERLRRIMENDYSSKELDDLLETKWKTKQEIPLSDDLVELKFEDDVIRDLQIKELLNESRRREEDDWAALFDELKHNMRRWWD